MNGIDIVICLVILALAALVIRYLIKEKKAGHKFCGFDCSTCSMCSHGGHGCSGGCHPKK